MLHHRWTVVVGGLARWLIATVLLSAAIGKMTDMWFQVAYLSRLHWLPDALATPVALGLPIVETVVALCLLLPPLSRFGLWAALSLMSVFSAFLLVSMVMGETEPCPCLGEQLLRNTIFSSLWFNLIRNSFLMFLCVVGLFAARRSAITSVDIHQKARASWQVDARSGFTLVELTVTIGLIALLLACTLPVLASVATRGRTASCLYRVGEIGKLASGWAAEHEGFLPLDGEVRREVLPLKTNVLAYLGDPRQTRYSYVRVDDFESGDYHGAFPEAMVDWASGPDNDIDFSSSKSWRDDIRPAASMAELLQCPDAEDRSHIFGFLGGVDSSIYNIGGDRYAFGRMTTSDYSSNGGLLGWDWDPAKQHRAYRGQVNRVVSPSTTMLIADGTGDFMSWTPDRDQAATHVTAADVLQDNSELRRWGPRKLPQVTAHRHGGQTNVVFVDAHAETVSTNIEQLGRIDLLRR